jgi:DNA mismatch repair protein MutS2
VVSDTTIHALITHAAVHLMKLSPATQSALRLDEIRTALGTRCRTEPGKVRALARPLLDDRDSVLRELELVREALALLHEPLKLPLSPVTDVRDSLERAGKGGMLEPRELIAITSCLFAFERTQEALLSRKDRLPSMAALGSELPDLDKLTTRLDRSFESSGEISDRASPELKEARDRARGLHNNIKARLDKLLHDEKFVAHLRENYYSLRNDRYVVPVLSQARAEVPGIVHNASQSGQTLFVEPTEMIGVGNDLAIAQSVVLEEERKVLIELSHQVGREAQAIRRGVEACARLDEAEAAAALADALDASAPELQPADGPLHLSGMRHPLLVLRGGVAEVVANDVDLPGEARALVVSGPNAGGKTVTLTAVGLCSLMVRAGLWIPVEPGSKLPLFEAVSSAVGDAQDLSAGLSTFSAHVTLLKEIVGSAGKGSLVLIDEIAADTDPREGAAIAIAVLEELIVKGALVLVTTHLEELKALAQVDPRFLNAKVGFDPRKMAPTYRLQLGSAGVSSAIDIARRVGLPEAICARATELAQGSGGALSKALAAAEEERRKMIEVRETAAREAAEAKALRERLTQELEAAEKKRREEEVRFRDGLKGELAYARQQIRALVEKLEAEQSLKAAKAASAELAERINEQEREGTRAKEALSPPPVAGPLKLEPGARARHTGLNADVEILSVDGDHAQVSMGAMKMRVPVKELVAPRTQGGPSRFQGDGGKKDVGLRLEAAAAKVPTLGAPSLDVRGMRAEDALRELERFLDRSLRAGDAEAIVIHGHGTGALKSVVREQLERSPYAKGFRPGDGSEGGDGVTVITLG